VEKRVTVAIDGDEKNYEYNLFSADVGKIRTGYGRCVAIVGDRRICGHILRTFMAATAVMVNRATTLSISCCSNKKDGCQSIVLCTGRGE
jgi:hypothetical protein